MHALPSRIYSSRYVEYDPAMHPGVGAQRAVAHPGCPPRLRLLARGHGRAELTRLRLFLRDRRYILAEVRLDHAWIDAHLGGRPGHDLAPKVQHGDLF